MCVHFEVDPPWSLEVKLLKTSLANGIRSDFHSCPSTRKGVAPLPIWARRWTLSQKQPQNARESRNMEGCGHAGKNFDTSDRQHQRLVLILDI